MVINLQDAPDTLAAKLEKSELAIFANSTPMKASDLAEEKNYGILKYLSTFKATQLIPFLISS
jgi:hypothetical protein